jgi:probable HAF family extracellular repeat protein
MEQRNWDAASRCTSGGNFSRALDVNDAGQVVGTSTSSSGERAFVWTRGAGIQDLNDALSNDVGIVFVEAHAINNKVGYLSWGWSGTKRA